MIWIYSILGVVILFLLICVLLAKHHTSELDRQFIQSVDLMWKNQNATTANEKDIIADDVLTKLYWQNAKDSLDFRSCGEALSRVAPIVIKDKEMLERFFDSYMRWGERIGASIPIQRKVYKWFKAALPGYSLFDKIQ